MIIYHQTHRQVQYTLLSSFGATEEFSSRQLPNREYSRAKEFPDLVNGLLLFRDFPPLLRTPSSSSYMGACLASESAPAKSPKKSAEVRIALVGSFAFEPRIR